MDPTAASPPLLSQPARFGLTPFTPSAGVFGSILTTSLPSSSDAYWLKGGVQILFGWGRSLPEEQEKVGMGELWNGGPHPQCLPGWSVPACPLPIQASERGATPLVKPSQAQIGAGHSLLFRVPVLGPWAPSLGITFLYFSPADWEALEHGNWIMNL